MRRIPLVAVLLLSVVGGGWLVRGASGSGSGVPAGAEAAVVARVVDGDTIRVLVDGESVPVRLLEVDTPEVDGNGQTEECGGPEASRWLAGRLPPGTRVRLEVDRSHTDRFDRLLRYVWTDEGELLNETLVHEGLGVAALYEPDDRHIERMRAAEAEARSEGRGLWGPPCSISPP